MNGTQALQLFLLGLVFGSTVGLLAVSFSLILSVTSRFHVAYMSSYVIGAYGAIYAYNDFVWGVWPSAVFGIFCATLLGVLIELLVYRPISIHTLNRGANPLIPTFIASLGISTLATNALSIHFNTAPLSFNLMSIEAFKIGSANIPKFDITEFLVSWVLILAIWAFLKFTQRGHWVVATRSNPELSATVGIKVSRIFLLVFAIGSAVAGILGIMQATSTSASPGMGFDQVFYGFLVAFLAGMSASPIKMAVYGVIIGLISYMCQLWVNPEWSNVVVFGILLVYVVYMSLKLRFPNLRLSPAALVGRA
ncbi:MAG: amino acid/amide transporter rane protein 1, family [Frankiales bacterium]|nr:amino acid/amide transporter rane protein 1, family [Frankiales bacterium]